MDKSIIDRCKVYVAKILAKKIELADYINESTILLNVYENNKLWDVMIIMDDDLYKYEFAHLNSEHFVVDDHKHDPLVFTRVKSYKWLNEDFAKRLPVALWIFQNAAIIQKSGRQFTQIIAEQEKILTKKIQALIKRKYLEMRGERHNLRYSVVRIDDMANILIKANIAKLCFELSLLASGKPYPFRMLLPEYAKDNVVNGEKLFCLTQKFLTTTDAKKIIVLSDKLIEFVIKRLQEKNYFSNDFLRRWWLYLD